MANYPGSYTLLASFLEVTTPRRPIFGYSISGNYLRIRINPALHQVARQEIASHYCWDLFVYVHLPGLGVSTNDTIITVQLIYIHDLASHCAGCRHGNERRDNRERGCKERLGQCTPGAFREWDRCTSRRISALFNYVHACHGQN